MRPTRALAYASLPLLVACNRAAATPQTTAMPAPLSALADVEAGLDESFGAIIAVRSTARLVRDPSATEPRLSLAGSDDSSDGPTHYTFELVGTTDGWLEIKSYAPRADTCSYAFALRGLRLRLFVSRDDVVLDPGRFSEACRDVPDDGYVDPSDEPALEVWGPRLAVVADMADAGWRIVSRRGFPSCIIQSRTDRVRVRERVEDPPLYWPDGTVAGYATVDMGMREPEPVGDRICFSAHDDRVHPEGAALRLCADPGHVQIRDTRQRWPDARPELLDHRAGKPLPLHGPPPLALPFAVVLAELRRRLEPIVACIAPPSRDQRFSLSVLPDGTALPTQEWGRQGGDCLEQAYNGSPWPVAAAGTGVDFVPQRLTDERARP